MARFDLRLRTIPVSDTIPQPAAGFPTAAMIGRLFHAWERRLAAVTSDRVVRGFEWGTEWLDGGECSTTAADEVVSAWSARAMEDTDRFFEVPATDRYQLQDGLLSFPSAFETPDPDNNTVYARYQPAAPDEGPRRAVVVLPHWNAGPEEHMGLSRLIARFGVSTLRLSLPYHDRRMPADLHRADYIVSANVGRTLQVCRQAVLDARRAVHWLAAQGYERIGILGTSLGSCLAMLTAAHEPRVTAAALNHISPYFATSFGKGSPRHMFAPDSTAISPSSICAGCGSRSVRNPMSSGCETSAHCWSTLAMTSRFRSGSPGSWWRSSSVEISPIGCWCCPAATTVRPSRRSAGWTDTP